MTNDGYGEQWPSEQFAPQRPNPADYPDSAGPEPDPAAGGAALDDSSPNPATSGQVDPETAFAADVDQRPDDNAEWRPESGV